MIFAVFWVETHNNIVVFDFYVGSKYLIYLSFCFFTYFYWESAAPHHVFEILYFIYTSFTQVYVYESTYVKQFLKGTYVPMKLTKKYLLNKKISNFYKINLYFLKT